MWGRGCRQRDRKFIWKSTQTEIARKIPKKKFREGIPATLDDETLSFYKKKSAGLEIAQENGLVSPKAHIITCGQVLYEKDADLKH